MLRRIALLLVLMFLAGGLPAAVQAQEVDLGLIMVKDRKLADSLRKRLLAGESFEALARKYSQGPTAARGGRLGLVPIKRLRLEFRQALKDLPPGRPSPVIPTEEGYAILMRFGAPPAAATAPPQTVPKAERFLQARQRVMAGLEAVVAGDLATGEKNLSRALGLNPHQPSVPFFLDMIRGARQGKYHKKAVITFAEGFLAMLSADPQRAHQLFARAAGQDPRLWQAKLFQANVAAGLGKRQEAKRLLTQVLAQNPKTPLAHVTLGLIARDQGRLDEARRQFRAALALDPDLAEAHYELGSLELQARRFAAAERQLRAAVAADPYREEAYNDLGLALAYQGKIKEAVSCYRKALELNPEYVAPHLNLGNLYAKRKKYERAIDEYNKALALNPALGEAHSNLAATYILTGDYDRALQHEAEARRLGYPVPEAITRALAPHRKRQSAPPARR